MPSLRYAGLLVFYLSFAIKKQELRDASENAAAASERSTRGTHAISARIHSVPIHFVTEDPPHRTCNCLSHTPATPTYASHIASLVLKRRSIFPGSMSGNGDTSPFSFPGTATERVNFPSQDSLNQILGKVPLHIQGRRVFYPSLSVPGLESKATLGFLTTRNSHSESPSLRVAYWTRMEMAFIPGHSSHTIGYSITDVGQRTKFSHDVHFVITTFFFYVKDQKLCANLNWISVLLNSDGYSLVAPLDLQQGGNSRIPYVHVPAARMSILVYIATAIKTFLFLLTKHPLFIRSSGTGTEIGAFLTLFTLVTGGFRGRPMWGTGVGCSFNLCIHLVPYLPGCTAFSILISRSGTSIHVPMLIPILSNFANSPFSTPIFFVLETRLPIPSFLESPLTEEIEAREGIPKPSSLAESFHPWLNGNREEELFGFSFCLLLCSTGLVRLTVNIYCDDISDKARVIGATITIYTLPIIWSLLENQNPYFDMDKTYHHIHKVLQSSTSKGIYQFHTQSKEVPVLRAGQRAKDDDKESKMKTTSALDASRVRNRDKSTNSASHSSGLPYSTTFFVFCSCALKKEYNKKDKINISTCMYETGDETGPTA
ncbi:hypothetical protein ZIOFF_074460 (mitochondrion) [Zingiber officinale]|uniref:Cytochrome c assembly protein domain-containing protein n=1 Tax=Zingiber officinale TaxID=94328 RepID=A0A8J5C5N4_ZINOF|nr:hypothetical protein ZIOFF_075484 [Zingiber officinale]KAG6467665.1 hypothetical protein ZIOFF_074460 [Zingiber officinale]